MKKSESYFISSGEFSGDMLAAELVLTLREVLPQFSPFGIVGPAMKKAGVKELISQDRLGMMGIGAVAKKLGDLRMLESFVVQKIVAEQPRFAVLVDFPGFHFRIAEQLKLHGIAVIQYVAPKLWAWGAKRLVRLQRDFDLVLGVLPFEQEYFAERGVRYKYVGSPHKDRAGRVMISAESLGLESLQPIVAMLPGSRAEELSLILPRLIEIKNLIHRQRPDVNFVLPLASNLSMADFYEAVGERAEGPPKTDEKTFANAVVYKGIHITRGMSLELMACSRVAIVASGTATLECALVGTPMVVLYVMNQLSYQIAKRAVNLSHFSLVNLVAQKAVVREFLQDFSNNEVADEIFALLEDGEPRQHMLQEFTNIKDSLSGKAAINAAYAIKDQLGLVAPKDEH
jgi:lipid-A-disaccharide synthase